MKTCKTCKIEKPVTEFWKHSKASDGLQSNCKTCANSLKAQWREEHPEQNQAASRRANTARGKEKSREYARAHYRANPERYKNRAKTWRETNKDKIKARYAELKFAVLNGYGAKCNCCGETTREFLTIDHVNNDGSEERQYIRPGKHLFQRIIATGFPSSYQILCYNCNCAKGVYGQCPHNLTVASG